MTKSPEESLLKSEETSEKPEVEALEQKINDPEFQKLAEHFLGKSALEIPALEDVPVTKDYSHSLKMSFHIQIFDASDWVKEGGEYFNDEDWKFWKEYILLSGVSKCLNNGLCTRAPEVVRGEDREKFPLWGKQSFRIKKDSFDNEGSVFYWGHSFWKYFDNVSQDDYPDKLTDIIGEISVERALELQQTIYEALSKIEGYFKQRFPEIQDNFWILQSGKVTKKFLDDYPQIPDEKEVEKLRAEGKLPDCLAD